MNKKSKMIISALLVCTLTFGGWKYVQYKNYCQVHFPSNTIINEVDCSGLTIAEAKKVLTTNWNKNSFDIIEDGKTIATLEDMEFQYTIEDGLRQIMDAGYKLPVYTTLFKKNAEQSVTMTPAKWTKSFDNQIAALPIYDQENPVTTENAYVNMENNQFEIVPEVYGNNIDQEKLKTAISETLSQGTWSLDFQEKDFYTLPTLKTDSEKILEEQAYCKKYLSHEITYTFGSNTLTLSPIDMDKMMSADDSGKVKVKEKKVKAFVKELAKTYNTVGTNRAFKSTSRGTVIVDGGTYGYTIDTAEEVEQLTKDLKGLKDVTREPVYAQAGWGWENNGFGTTYVEVDLALQKLWYYQNGQILLTSDFVSGNVAEHYNTPTGAFAIVYMAQDVTLKGGNKEDGTDYASHVDYWMPFYSDYGLHDASWRSSFGGKIYLTGGSHGCVNMPPAKAAQLYYLISTGTPVIVIN